MTKFSEKSEKTIGDFNVVESAAIDENGAEKDIFHLKENDIVVVICHDPAFNFYCVKSEVPTLAEPILRLPQAELKNGETSLDCVLALLKNAFEISPDKVLSISRLMTGMTDSARSTRHEYLIKVLVESGASKSQTARADEVLQALSSPDAQLSHKLLWSLIVPEVENYYRMISSKDGNSASE